MVELLINILQESWHILLDASVYILLGLAVAGLIRVLLNPDSVARHMGNGHFAPVLKAALIGIPLPL
jgi:uncharacterized membrane protein YraQ (UPF0718 family)